MRYQDILVFFLILGNTLINLISVTGGNYFLLLSLTITVAYFINNKLNYKSHLIIKLYGVLALFSLLGILYAENIEYLFHDLTKVFSNLFVMVVCYDYITRNNNLKKLLIFFVVSISLLALPNALFSNIGEREMFWGGVNPVGAMMFFSIVSIILLVYLKCYWFLILLPLQLYVLFLSQSQKIILSLVICAILFLIINMVKRGFFKNIKILFLVVILFGGATYLLTTSRFSDSLDRTTATLQQLVTNEYVTGSAFGASNYRDFLINEGFSYFLESPFIGYGLNNSRHLFAINTGAATYTHNTWIETLISYGLFFTFLYLLIYSIVFIKLIQAVLKQKSSIYYFLLSIWVAIVIIGQFQKMLYDINTHVFFLIALYLSEKNFKELKYV